MRTDRDPATHLRHAFVRDGRLDHGCLGRRNGGRVLARATDAAGSAAGR